MACEWSIISGPFAARMWSIIGGPSAAGLRSSSGRFVATPLGCRSVARLGPRYTLCVAKKVGSTHWSLGSQYALVRTEPLRSGSEVGSMHWCTHVSRGLARDEVVLFLTARCSPVWGGKWWQWEVCVGGGADPIWCRVQSSVRAAAEGSRFNGRGGPPPKNGTGPASGTGAVPGEGDKVLGRCGPGLSSTGRPGLDPVLGPGFAAATAAAVGPAEPPHPPPVAKAAGDRLAILGHAPAQTHARALCSHRSARCTATRTG